MKNNQYLQKYGQKALEILNKKNFKQVVDFNNQNISQEQDQNIHTNQQQKESVIEDRNYIRNAKQQLKNKSLGKGNDKVIKTGSQKSLCKHSKSKQKSKSNILTNNQYQNQYTFQKPLNMQSLLNKNKQNDKNRKKLIISGLSTPKNRSARMVSAIEQKIQSSSTKKKISDIKISQKLNDVLLNKSKPIKSMAKQLLQCLDMISQHQSKISKWINQLKDIVYYITNQTAIYKKKYKQQNIKYKRLQKQMQEIQNSLKNSVNYDNKCQKKRKPLQMVIMEENQKLRQKIQKLETKIQNYQKKQMVLVQTLQSMRIQKSKKGKHQTNESSKKQSNHATTKIKAEFYGSLDEDDGEDGDQQDDQLIQEQENFIK